MCGRYASARQRQELFAEFLVERDLTGEPLEPDYNVAPTKPVYAVLTRRDRERSEDADPVRQLRVLQWGLVPSWAKDASGAARLINARAETVDSKPSFRRALARRRCLLPADGYFEWVAVTDGGKTRKQPYYIQRADGGVLAFAGLYEIWRDKERPEDDPGAWLWTSVIITTSAPDETGRIHDRMPMVIDSGRWEDWLDPSATEAADVQPLLAPAAASGLQSCLVDPGVNSVRNNGPGLIRPLSPELVAAGTARAGGPQGHPAAPPGLF